MKAIEINNLVKNFGKTKAVDDISFSVEEGSITAILGPNGSGKTTTIKSICNIIIPDGGSIKINGKSNKKSIDRIAALFEGTRNLYWRLTPAENLRYFAGIRGLGGKKIENRIDELLERFNLMDKKNTLVNNLSRGMQQKVAIAMTLICDTDIIILDEPTLGLDVESCLDIKDVLRSISADMKKTVLLSTHDMHLVQDVCNDVIIINKGKIIAHDAMDNLLGMFRNMTYEFILNESLTEEDIKNLSAAGYEFYFTNSNTVIETDISDSQVIYDIVDLLKKNNLSIREIKQSDINFERVYLNLTGGGTK